MRKKLFHFLTLAILGMALSCGLVPMLMAQTTLSDIDRQTPANQKVYKFRSLDYPGAENSYAYDFNGKTAVGRFIEPNVGAAFYVTGTSYHPLNIPGATSSEIDGVNTSGEMVGPFTDSNRQTHGFLYTGKTFLTLDFPGAGSTAAWDINDAGLIVGSYDDSDGVTHGFLYKKGSFTALNVPAAKFTYATGINSTGEIVGFYADSGGTEHGFLQHNGIYSSLDFPNAASTFALGINDAGAVAGGWGDSGGSVIHGFISSGGVYTKWTSHRPAIRNGIGSRTMARSSDSCRIASARPTVLSATDTRYDVAKSIPLRLSRKRESNRHGITVL